MKDLENKQRLLKLELDTANNRYCSIEGFEPPDSWINMIGLKTSAQKEHTQKLEEARKPITRYVKQLEVLEQKAKAVKRSTSYSMYLKIEKFNHKVDEEIKRIDLETAARWQDQAQHHNYHILDDTDNIYTNGLHSRL